MNHMISIAYLAPYVHMFMVRILLTALVRLLQTRGRRLLGVFTSASSTQMCHPISTTSQSRRSSHLSPQLSPQLSHAVGHSLHFRTLEIAEIAM